jgi:CDP-diglyceride synthetase
MTMTLYQWFVFFLFTQIVHFLGTWKLYEAAGRKKWEAAIPVYNAIVLMRIISFYPNYQPDYVSSNLGRNFKKFWKTQST